MENAFEIKNLLKSYNGQTVLDIETAGFPVGKITALTGPNGCGKTTLLECLAALQQPDSGSIIYHGEPISALSRKKITLVFQSPYLFNDTVEYNVSYGLRMRRKKAGGAVDDTLKAVRLEGFNRRSAWSLSGGEARRVAIARALAFSPETLLLDEPAANIDAENVEIIEEIVKSLSAGRGTTIIMATHSRRQAARLACQTFQIQAGRLNPLSSDNYFKAALTVNGNQKILTTKEGLKAIVETDRETEEETSRKTGEVFFTIPPEKIALSVAIPGFHSETAEGNSWRGVIISLELVKDKIRIVCDAGMPLVVLIPQEAYKEMRPLIGDAVYLNFDPFSIKIL